MYLSANAATALLEVLANLKGDPTLFPATYQLIKARATPDLPVLTADVEGVEAMTETQALGDAWLAGMASALLLVPSVPAPESMNYLLNPKHPDASKLHIESVRRIAFDRRLFHLDKP